MLIFFCNSNNYFYRIIISNFKKKFNNAIALDNFYSKKLKKLIKIIINFYLLKKVLPSTMQKKYSIFYKNSQRNKMFSLFKGNTEDKLKVLKFAKELAHKSTLPILRKSLRDISLEVIEISALLIRKFK